MDTEVHPRHEDGSFCPSCEQKLTQAHPDLVSWYRKKKDKYKNLHISWSFRDQATQDRLYLEGKTKAKFPMSNHNNMKDGKPLALALDLFQIDEDGIARFTKPFYALLAREAKKDKDPIQWAGNWTSFQGDYSHFGLITQKKDVVSEDS